MAGNARRLRGAEKVSQDKLSERAGLSLVFYQRIERAETNLSLDALVQLAVALKVEPRDLLKPAVMPAIKRGRPPKPRKR